MDTKKTAQIIDATPTKEFLAAYHRVCGEDAAETPAAVIGALRAGLGDSIREEMDKMRAEAKVSNQEGDQ